MLTFLPTFASNTFSLFYGIFIRSNEQKENWNKIYLYVLNEKASGSKVAFSYMVLLRFPVFPLLFYNESNQARHIRHFALLSY